MAKVSKKRSGARERRAAEDTRRHGHGTRSGREKRLEGKRSGAPLAPKTAERPARVCAAQRDDRRRVSRHVGDNCVRAWQERKGRPKGAKYAIAIFPGAFDRGRSPFAPLVVVSALSWTSCTLGVLATLWGLAFHLVSNPPLCISGGPGSGAEATSRFPMPLPSTRTPPRIFLFPTGVPAIPPTLPRPRPRARGRPGSSHAIGLEPPFLPTSEAEGPPTRSV